MGRNIQTDMAVDIAARYPLSTWNSIAAYALLEHNLSEKTDLQAGLRYNFFFLNADFSNNENFFPLPESEEQLNNGGIAGNVGIIYRTESQGEYRIQVSTGFRSPNVDDVGKVFDSEPGSVVVPNPELKPEYAYNAEVGLNQVLFKNVRVDVTGYFTWLDNAMIRRDFTFNGNDSIIYDGVLSQVQAIQNASESLIYGVQLGLALQLPGDWLIDGRLNIQRGTDRTTDGVESPTRHASPMFGTARLSRSFRKWKILAYTNFSATRKFDDMPVEEIGKPHLYASDSNGNPYAPGWYTLNLRGSFELNDKLLFSLGAENLTNQRYRPYSSGLSGAGLNFIASARISF
jgi:hemoglobin/transferrin/lactoferrin receptor protein